MFVCLANKCPQFLCWDPNGSADLCFNVSGCLWLRVLQLRLVSHTIASMDKHVYHLISNYRNAALLTFLVIFCHGGWCIQKALVNPLSILSCFHTFILQLIKITYNFYVIVWCFFPSPRQKEEKKEKGGKKKKSIIWCCVRMNSHMLYYREFLILISMI